VRVLHALQHLQLVVYHLLVSPHILLQDDLDGNLALGTVGLSHDAICPSAECSSEAIAGPARDFSAKGLQARDQWRYELAIIAIRLAVQLVEHVCH
jgi:hypothetical protein